MNNERAAFALAAVRGYRRRKQPDSEPVREQLVDLLTDMRHMCRAQGLDFVAALEMSAIHFSAETKNHE